MPTIDAFRLRITQRLPRYVLMLILFFILALSVTFFFFAVSAFVASKRAPQAAAGRAAKFAPPKDAEKPAAGPAAPRIVPVAPVVAPPAAPASTLPACPFTGGALAMAAATEEVVARAAPMQGAATVRDSAGRDRIFEPRDELRLLETRPGWVRLRRLAAKWPPAAKEEWEGWAPDKAIRPARGMADALTPDEKACLFLDPAVWRGATGALPQQIRDAARRILREDPRCRLIAGGGMMGESQRFYLTCSPADGGQPYHYWLSASTLDRPFKPAAPVDEGAAMTACRTKLEKLLGGQSAMRGGADDFDIGSLSSYRERDSYYMTIDYRLGAAGQMKAYCFVPPGRDAEITLADSP